jgi:recombination protein RecA
MTKEKGLLTNVEDTNLINDNLRKTYGDNVVTPGDTIVDEDTRIVPLSPRLDLITHGVPDGTWMTVTGVSGCGKTTLALHYAAKAQRPEYGNREVYYIDIEGRLKKINLKGIPGLNMKKFHAVRSHKKRILSGQEYLKAAEDVLKGVSNVVVIIDSYSALCHENELMGDVGMSTRGSGGYTLLSQFCRQMCNVVPVMKSNVIGITHLMANVGSPYGGLMEKSGTSLTYHADIRIKAKKFVPWAVGSGEKTKRVGQIVTWLCEKSAMGGPGGEVDGYIRYGKGIDELYELILVAVDSGLIEEAGAGWHTITYTGEKFHGGEKLYQMLLENELARNELLNRLKAMIQT